MNDAYRLPVTRWEATENSRAVVLAAHGLNDYSNAFVETGKYLAAHGITLLAYDQRGFGGTAEHGVWHGADRMIEDLNTMTALVRQRYGEQSLFLLGESMGGAVVLASLGKAPLQADGIILVAPAVWSRASMPAYQRLALWIAAHTMPDRPLTGKGLHLHPSDNIDMLRALSRDPLVIKPTRVDVLYGVSNLMDVAADSARQISDHTLILYGLHDDIIPRQPACRFFLQLPDNPGQDLTVIFYANGYHMLTRDLQGEVVLADITRWINVRNDPAKPPLPGNKRIEQVCGEP